MNAGEMDALASEAEDLIEEFQRGYFDPSGDHPRTAEVRRRIVAKLQEANRAYPREARSNKGGAPAKYNWDEFLDEVVRIANTIDGLPTRAELQRRMMEFCSTRWGDDVPGESTVREKLAPFASLCCP
jgi:hypothetical protein